MNVIVEDFLLKVDESEKFIVLSDDIKNFLYNDNSSEYIIIRPVKSDLFQIEVKKEKGEEDWEYTIHPVIITDDEDEFKLNLKVQNRKSLETLVKLTADALRRNKNTKKFAKPLENLL